MVMIIVIIVIITNKDNHNVYVYIYIYIYIYMVTLVVIGNTRDSAKPRRAPDSRGGNPQNGNLEIAPWTNVNMETENGILKKSGKWKSGNQEKGTGLTQWKSGNSGSAPAGSYFSGARFPWAREGPRSSRPGVLTAWIYIYIYIYICMERERERERDLSLSLSLSIYIYIYI